MKIPTKVVINGVSYNVNITDKLALGLDYGGEIAYDVQEINIRPFTEERQQLIFLHECVHGMLKSLGYSEHDEKLVDGLAHQLWMFIKDNPDMLGENEDEQNQGNG